MASPSIHAMAEGASAATEFPSTTAGLQAAIDSLAGAKGKVFIGPGTLEITTVISLHSNCHLQGSGVDVTIIKRASGSLTAADATGSGSMLLSTAYGANGTLTTGTGQCDEVTISDLTLDGNQSAFAIDPSTPTHMGIRFRYVDGARVERVSVKNFLQTGIQFDTCRKVFVGKVWISTVGQYASASSRNGITLVDNNGTANYSRDAVISDVISDTLNDAHFYNSWSNVAYNNITIRGGGVFGFEMETTSTQTAVARVTIENVVATGLTKEFLRIGQLSGSGTTFDDILCRNCACLFDASAHIGFAVRIANSANVIVSRFKVVGCTFSNCNSGDQANNPFVFHNCTNTGTPSKDITIEGCEFNCGAPSSTTTSSHGMDIRGNNKRIRIIGNTIRDAAGYGIFVRTGTASCNLDGLDIVGNYTYNSTSSGIGVLTTTASTTIKNVNVCDNYVEDACEATNTAGIFIGPSTASSTMQNVTISRNRVNQASSTTMTRGLTLEAGAGSTSDLYFIHGNEMINLDSGSDLCYANTGTHTNVHFSDPVVHGSDVGSAATVTLRRGTLFHVTGTTAITTLNPQVTWERRPITFIMDSTASFTDGGNMKLAGNGPNSADDTITMAYDGTSWYEVARSTN